MNMDAFNNYRQSTSWIKTNLGKYILSQEMQSLSKLLLDIQSLKKFLLVGEIEFFLDFNKLLKLFYKDQHIEQLILNPNLNTLDIKKNDFLLKLRGHLIVSDPSKLPIENNSIDLICLPHTLENLYAYLELLCEIYRILKPGGRIMVTGFNKPIFGWYFKKLINNKNYPIKCINNFFTPNQFKHLLISLGFNEIKIEYNCYNLLTNNKFLLNRLKFLEKIGRFFPYIKGNIYVISACKKVLPLTPTYCEEWSDIVLDNDLAKNILKS